MSRGHGFDECGHVLLEAIVHDFHAGRVPHGTEGFFGRDFLHAAFPAQEVALGNLALVVAVPDDLEDRELHEVEEVLADFVGSGGELDIVAIDLGERRIRDAHFAQVHLHLDEPGEVAEPGSGAAFGKLGSGVDEAASYGEAGEGLEHDLEFLEGHSRRVRRQDRKQAPSVPGIGPDLGLLGLKGGCGWAVNRGKCGRCG